MNLQRVLSDTSSDIEYILSNNTEKFKSALYLFREKMNN